MKRWEYKVAIMIQGVRAFEKQLNEFGEDGWELCAKFGLGLAFKREKRCLSGNIKESN